MPNDDTPSDSAASQPDAPRSTGWQRARFPLFVVIMLTLIAASTVSSPYTVERSIAPIDAFSLIRDSKGKGISGDAPAFFLPVLDVREARWLEVAWWKLRDSDVLGTSTDEEQAPGGSEDSCGEHGGQSDAQLFRDSQQLATYHAMNAAGGAPELVGDGVVVWALGTYGVGGPLRCGDVITEINGVPVATWPEAQKATHDLIRGQRPVVRLSDGTEVQLDAIREDVDAYGPELRVARVLGVAAVETLRPSVSNAPIDWDVPESVGGTSGGLAMYLAAIAVPAPKSADAKALVELEKTGDVWATGELSGSGAVYGVGGMEAKMRGARDLGLGAIVVSYANEDVARDFAGDAHVVPLDSVDELPQAVAENL